MIYIINFVILWIVLKFYKPSLENFIKSNKICIWKNDTMNDKIILVVSFGTSYNNNRNLSIGAIEKDIEDSFPDYEIRRAFTSQMIINKLKKRDDLHIDNVKEALERAVEDGVKTVIVQPTHMMDGTEYHFKIKDHLDDFKDKFDTLVLGKPLIKYDEDYEDLINCITATEYDDDTAVCFMGHGTPAESNEIYTKLQDKLLSKNYKNYYVGTVEAEPSFDDVLAMIKEGDYNKIVLKPLMVVAGDHAQNDMAGDEDDSWKSMFASNGYEVECVIEGLAQSKDVRNMYIKHLQETIDDLN